MSTPEEVPEVVPSARKAGIHAVWTVVIGLVISVVGTVLVDQAFGTASLSGTYISHLVGGLGLTAVIWAVWVTAIAVRFRAEPARRRAQLITGAGLISAFIEALINGISATAAGAFGTAAFALIPVVLGIVVFTIASAIGAYGSIPIATRSNKS